MIVPALDVKKPASVLAGFFLLLSYQNLWLYCTDKRTERGAV